MLSSRRVVSRALSSLLLGPLASSAAHRVFHNISASSFAQLTACAGPEVSPAEAAAALSAMHTAQHTLVMRDSALRKFGPARDPRGDAEPTDARYALLSSLARFKVAYASVPASKAGSSDARHESFPVADSVSDDVTVERVHKHMEVATARGVFACNYGWSAQRTTMDMGLNGSLTKLLISTPVVSASTTATATAASESTAAASDVVAVSSYSYSDAPSPSALSPEGAEALQALLAALRESEPLPATPRALEALTAEELNWWLCYALTHPSNWAFDRITQHLLPRN